MDPKITKLISRIAQNDPSLERAVFGYASINQVEHQQLLIDALTNNSHLVDLQIQYTHFTKLDALCQPNCLPQLPLIRLNLSSNPELFGLTAEDRIGQYATIDRLRDYLQQSKIQDLCLGACRLRNDGLERLTQDSHCHFPYLKYISLCENYISHDGAHALSRLLSSNPGLIVDLDGNKLSHDGIVALVEDLKKKKERNTKIMMNTTSSSCCCSLNQTWNLSANCIVSDIATKALATLPPHTITSLNLSSNRLGDEGAIALIPMLSSLKKLYLGDTNMGNDSVQLFAQALHDSATTLQILDLSNNCIQTSGAMALAHALTINTTLQELFLCSKSTIGTEAAIAMATTLRNSNTTLTCIELTAYNDVSLNALQEMEFYTKLNTIGIRSIITHEWNAFFSSIEPERFAKLQTKNDILYFIIREIPTLLEDVTMTDGC